MATIEGVEEIEVNGNSVEIESIARFAVDELNKKENALLEFTRVLNAKQQVVAGTRYTITLEVRDGDHAEFYEAKVWEKPWLNFKELQEVKLLATSTTSTRCSRSTSSIS